MTLQVLVGPHVLRGREVEGLLVWDADAEHARCWLTFDRDPSAAHRAASALRAADLVGAPVRVVCTYEGLYEGLYEAASEGAAGAGAEDVVVFEGVVDEFVERARRDGASRFHVTAVTRSGRLGVQRRQARFPAHTAVQLACALGARVNGPVADDAPIHRVQHGVSDWEALVGLCAEAGLQLRPVWPRTAAEAPAAPDGALAEVRAGFADVTTTLTWQVELQALDTRARPVDHAVAGAHYEVAAKHDHRFRAVRREPAWLSGAAPLVAAVRGATRPGPDNPVAPGLPPGSDAGVVEAGLVTGARRAPTLGEAYEGLSRESARRLGRAVAAVGRSTHPALRAGDRVDVRAPAGRPLDAAGVFGLVAVLHRWDGALYDNAFGATPWAGYHGGRDGNADAAAGGPAALAAALDEVRAALAAGRAAQEAAHMMGAARSPAATPVVFGRPAPAGADPGGAALPHALLGAALAAHAAHTVHAAPPSGAAAAGLSLGVVVDNDDPRGMGRVRVRFWWQDADAPPAQCAWARVASLYAGHQRGAGWLPEVGDEVAVGHVDGDPEQPVVLGSVHNGVDRAAHGPGRKTLATAGGLGLIFQEPGRPAAGAPGPVLPAEALLHTTGAENALRLTNAGAGSPARTLVHSEGEIVFSAKVAIRLVAPTVTIHTAGDLVAHVGGAHTVKAGGAITVESGAELGLSGAGGAALVAAGGVLRTHAGSAHCHTGAPLHLAPAGAAAPRVRAAVPAAPTVAPPVALVPPVVRGRSTEDPPLRPPRPAPPPPASLVLGYQHGDDGAPMAGARYRVHLADGTVRDGTLDGDGAARLDGLPARLAGTEARVRFFDAGPFALVRAEPDVPNPDFRGVAALASLTAAPPRGPVPAGPSGGEARLIPAVYQPDDGPQFVLASGAGGPAAAGPPRGLAGVLAEAPDVAEDALEFLWGVLLGAYKRDPTTGEVVGQVLVAMVPVVGQLADARDLSAYVYQLTRPLPAAERRAAWLGVLLTGVALAIPVAGAALAGVGRLALRGRPEAPALAVALLRRVGRGDVLAYARRQLGGGALARAALDGLGRVLTILGRFFAAVRDTRAPVGAGARRAAGEALAALGRVGEEARSALASLAEEVAAKVKPLLSQAEREGEHAAGAVGGRVEAEAPAAGAHPGNSVDTPHGPD